MVTAALVLPTISGVDNTTSGLKKSILLSTCNVYTAPASFVAVTVLTPTQLNAGLARFIYAPFAGRLGVETSNCGIEPSASTLAALMAEP